jgi:hypothetical protein
MIENIATRVCFIERSPFVLFSAGLGSRRFRTVARAHLLRPATNARLWRRPVNRNRRFQNRALGDVGCCMFGVCGSQLASAKRTVTNARSGYIPCEHDHCLALYRDFRANRAGHRSARGRVGTEETCSLAQPLVESSRTVPPLLATNVVAIPKKRPVTPSDNLGQVVNCN